MNRCLTYKYFLVLIIIQSVYCSDKQSDAQDIIEIDSDEDDNFEVTEQATGQPTQSPIPSQQPFVQEEEQLEPLDLSMKPSQPQPQPPYQPIQPLQPTIPHYPGLQLPIHQQIPGYPRFQLLPGLIQPPTPTQPLQPQPPLPTHPRPPLQPRYFVRPIPRYPQGPYPRYYHPGYPPYSAYAPPTEPYQQLPTHYGPQKKSDDKDKSDEKYVPPYQKKPKKKVVRKLKCKTISFVKKNKNGKLVSMSAEDYVESFHENLVSKYIFKANLEQLYCNDEVIYHHNPEEKYCKCLTFNVKGNYFVITTDDKFCVMKKYKGKWREMDLSIDSDIKLYGIDKEGKPIVIDENHYYTELTRKDFIKIVPIDGIKLTKVTAGEQTIWEKPDKGNYPLWVTFTIFNNIVIEFGKYFSVFKKDGTKYMLYFTRTK